ncbi:hypothetical protein ANCDUO_18265 [Ancylostoma duodenale]|uniref:Uncharacterized protein n=1 Tax=Ancylostoma duodenale TaxID=51022 RepID=A0A0C2CPD5_9BILA|nr:hypothetical protein ANCDUO_18265 [Ancylostoma duodenale]
MRQVVVVVVDLGIPRGGFGGGSFGYGGFGGVYICENGGRVVLCSEGVTLVTRLQVQVPCQRNRLNHCQRSEEWLREL